METAYLRTFVSVVECGSMSEAARQLHLTPAAVAQQLRVLEREVGVALLRRVGRTVRPTVAGDRLLDRARALLRDVADLRAVVADRGAPPELVIGATYTMLLGLVSTALTSLLQSHPAARVVVRSGLSSELYDGLLRQDLDAAFCQHPDFALPKTLHWEPLREERLVVLAPRAWAGRDPHQLLRDEPLIRYDRRLGGGRAAERYLSRARIVPRERLEVSSLEAIALLVSRGLGISIAPDATTTWWPTLPVARLALPLPQPVGARRFGVIWSRGSLRLAAIETLVEHARRAAAETAED